MTLDEYRLAIEKGERGEFEDAPGNKGATKVMFGVMVFELRNGLWADRKLKMEARELAIRAERLAYTRY